MEPGIWLHQKPPAFPDLGRIYHPTPFPIGMGDDPIRFLGLDHIIPLCDLRGSTISVELNLNKNEGRTLK